MGYKSQSYENQAKTIIKNLEKRNMKGYYCETGEKALEPQELVDLLAAERRHREVAQHRRDAADVDHTGVVLIRHPHPGWSGEVGVNSFGSIAYFNHV